MCLGPQLMQALVAAKSQQDAAGWQQFQAGVSGLKLRRSRLVGEAQEVEAALEEARRREREAGRVDEYDAGEAWGARLRRTFWGMHTAGDGGG